MLIVAVQYGCRRKNLSWWLDLWLVVEITVKDVANVRIGVTRDAEFLECSKITAKTSGRSNFVSGA